MVVTRVPEQLYPPGYLFHPWVQRVEPRFQGGNFKKADFRLRGKLSKDGISAFCSNGLPSLEPFSLRQNMCLLESGCLDGAGSWTDCL